MQSEVCSYMQLKRITVLIIKWKKVPDLLKTRVLTNVVQISKCKNTVQQASNITVIYMHMHSAKRIVVQTSHLIALNNVYWFKQFTEIWKRKSYNKTKVTNGDCPRAHLTL